MLTADQESAVTSAAQLEGVLNQNGGDTRWALFWDGILVVKQKLSYQQW